MTDYPDWQVFSNAQSTNLFPDFTQVLAPGVNDGTMIAALSWSSLIIIAEAGDGAGQLTVTHFADEAGTLSIDSDTWPVNSTTKLVVRTPLRGPYVRIDVNVTSAGNMTLFNWANFLSASSDRISFPVGQQNLSDFNHALAASGDITYTAGEITAGMAYFYFKPYDTTGKLAVVLHAVDELGNPAQLIADWGKPTALLHELITVPDLILQVEVQNTDATATHTYDFSLTIPPQ